MGVRLQHWRSIGAGVFSLVLIVGAYLLAQNAFSPHQAEASTETALLQSISTKDSDTDGLPDWEEALYGTDPHNPDSKHLGMTDGEAVAKGLIIPAAIATVSGPSDIPGPVVDPSLPRAPADGTLTAAFAKNFFTIYLAALQRSGGTLSQADMQDVAQQSLADLSASIARAPDFKSANDLKLVANSPDAMKAFAVSAEAVMNANTSNATTSELAYLEYSENGDASAIGHITSLAKAYRGSAAGIAALPVPRQLAIQDLALINALARVSEMANDFASVETDPIVTMLALEQYPGAVVALVNAFDGLAADYRTAGIVFAPGTAGASFVNIVSDIANDQSAGTTTQP